LTAAPLLLRRWIKDFRERNNDLGIFGPQQAIRDFAATLRCIDPGPVLSRIDDPAVRHSEPKVVVNALLHLGQAIVLRENFDADERRLREDLFGWLQADDYTDIRNAESSC